METYSLRLVTARLKERGVPFVHSSARVYGVNLVEHGVRVAIDGDGDGDGGRYNLSVQTHPLVCGESFAETALQRIDTNGEGDGGGGDGGGGGGSIVYDGTLGYHDVRRFYTPAELFAHLDEVLTKKVTKNENTNKDEEVAAAAARRPRKAAACPWRDLFRNA
jgi:hypothetical protein